MARVGHQLVAAQVAGEKPVFSSRGREYKTIDIAPCGKDFCGVSVADNGRCGPTLFRFLMKRANGETELRGHGKWGGARKNVLIWLFDSDDAHKGMQVYLGIWISANAEDNAKEIAAALALAKAHPKAVRALVVGNEVMLRREMTGEQLADNRRRFRLLRLREHREQQNGRDENQSCHRCVRVKSVKAGHLYHPRPGVCQLLRAAVSDGPDDEENCRKGHAGERPAKGSAPEESERDCGQKPCGP